MNSTGPHGNVAETSDKADAVASLFYTLTAIFVAIFMGTATVKLKLVVPQNGDLKGLGFFTGKIAFPLLIFKTMATADLGAVNLSVIAACALGKVVVMIVGFAASFFAYKPKRGLGQRILTSAVFAFFCIASNDFALGFPVIEALYGPSKAVYIAGNALVGSAVFVPLVFVLFGIGDNLKKQADHSKEGIENGSSGVCATAIAIFQSLIMDPVIIFTILGVLYKVFFGSSLVQVGTELHLPSPLSNVVELITSPFGMSALFLTGTSLTHLRIDFWSSFLVMLKVIVCAYFSYLFARLLLPDSSDPGLSDDVAKTLKNFAFFYGTIPTSSAPLIFAQEFDPEAAGLVSSAILNGLLLGAPILMVLASFLQRDADESSTASEAGTLAAVQMGMAYVSLLCGALLIGIFILLRTHFGVRCAVKHVVAWYGVFSIACTLGMLLMNPRVDPKPCADWQKSTWLLFPQINSWLQQSCDLIALLLQFLRLSPARSIQRVMLGAMFAFGCVMIAIAPGMFVPPATLAQICNSESYFASEALADDVLYRFLGWVVVKFCVGAVLIAATVHSSKKHDGLETLEKYDTEEDSDTSSQEDASSEGQDIRSVNGLVPNSVIKAIVTTAMLRFIIQIINALQVMMKQTVTGSFAQMLVIETILENARPAILLAAVIFDDVFSNKISSSMKKVGRQCWAALRGRRWKEHDEGVEDDVVATSSLERAATTVTLAF